MCCFVIGKENLVSISNLIKPAICAATGALMMCACTVSSEDKEIPNHSWFKGQAYGTEGAGDAEQATLAYSQGRFNDAENYVIQALRLNPRQPQALMVGALVYEKLGRLNRARQYYEDLIIVGGEETTILGTKDGTPERMSEVARRRLRRLNMQQSEFMIEDKDGVMTFNISKEAAGRQGKSAMEEALFVREQQMIANNQADAEANIKAVELLFSDDEKTVISRFLIMKELAEKDMITKQEFLAGRQANIGGLLPLTHRPPAYGINHPVPSPDLILERINSLKEAVEARAISPQEFSAERDLIVEAILPPNPRQRIRPKAPAKDIMTAAKDLRKLEVIYDMNLITADEKQQEKAAIEKYLGINRTPPAKKTAPAPAKKTRPASKPQPEEIKVELETPKGEPKLLTPPVSSPTVKTEELQVLVPEVTSPFK